MLKTNFLNNSMKCNIVDTDSLNKISRNHEVLSISTEEFFVKLVVIYCEDKSPICVNWIKEKIDS